MSVFRLPMLVSRGITLPYQLNVSTQVLLAFQLESPGKAAWQIACRIFIPGKIIVQHSR